MNDKKIEDRSSYELRYIKISNWFQAKNYRMNLLKILYRYVPLIVAASYIYLIIWSFINADLNVTMRVILVPFIAFVTVSIMRKIFDRPRPYTKYQITPLIRKNKVGESFPSRHTLSVSIIAMTWLYVNIPVGIALWVITLVIASTRVLSGVHFFKDVVAAIGISILFGLVGFYFIP